MIRKMACVMAFLVLGCILAEAQEHRDKPAFSKEPIGPLIWAPEHKLRKAKTYLSLGWGSDKPLDITSRKANTKAITNGKKIIFEGNVKVKQGDVTLTCDELVIIYDERTKSRTAGGRAKSLPRGLTTASQIKSITASGNVKIIQNERMAQGDEATYDNWKGTIFLKGIPAFLRDGPESLNGGQIIINRDENRTEQ
jgi:lipopolysaccharide export system protein LptA